MNQFPGSMQYPPYPQMHPAGFLQNPVFPFPMNRTPMAPPLYIGNLDEQIQEETLFEFFSKFGGLHFVRIMRDNVTGKSRGFGFVNFVHPRDAETARQFAQGEKLGRKHIRIMFKRNVKELPAEANVFVRNLDKSVTPKELIEEFSKCGPVLSVRIADDEEYKSLGYAYLQFEKIEDAKKALDQLNGITIKENQIILETYVPKTQRPDSNLQKNIYLKNFPEHLSEAEIGEQVRDFFSKYGKIQSSIVKKHPKEIKYCGFVCYESEEEAKRAFDDVSEKKITFPGASEPLYINWHQSKMIRSRELKNQHQNAINETNLFLRDLKLTTSENDLEKAFKRFGTITSTACRDTTLPDGSQRRMGFLNFEHVDGAENALIEASSIKEICDLFTSGKANIVKLIPKEKRQAFLASKRKWKQTQQMQSNFFPNQFPQMDNFSGRRFGLFNQQRQFKGPRAHTGQWNDSRQYSHSQGRPQHKNQGQYPQQRQYNMQNRAQNNPVSLTNQPQMDVPVQAQPVQPEPAITVKNLRDKLPQFLGLDENKQRQILGELLFPLVHNNIAEKDLAPKITGMLIDLSVLEVTEILEFLENPELLKDRVKEAIELIESEGA